MYMLKKYLLVSSYRCPIVGRMTQQSLKGGSLLVLIVGF